MNNLHPKVTPEFEAMVISVMKQYDVALKQMKDEPKSLADVFQKEGEVCGWFRNQTAPFNNSMRFCEALAVAAITWMKEKIEATDTDYGRMHVPEFKEKIFSTLDKEIQK